MTTDGHLYRGTVEDHFTDKDDELRGLLLKDAKRFQYSKLEADRKTGKQKPNEHYWKEIPGSNLYVPFDKMVTLNLRYELPEHDLLERLQAQVTKLTGIPNIILKQESEGTTHKKQEPGA